jgi:hypothetical protein
MGLNHHSNVAQGQAVIRKFNVGLRNLKTVANNAIKRSQSEGRQQPARFSNDYGPPQQPSYRRRRDDY